MKRTILFIIIFSLFLFGDQNLAPRPYIKEIWNGTYYFKMVPDTIKNIPWITNAHGYLYEVKSTEHDSLIWKVECRFTFQVFFPEYDIDYFTLVGDWPIGNKPNSSDMAIAFYKRDSLLKFYSTEELVKDITKFKHTVSHYKFLKRIIGFKEKYIFSIETIDNFVHIFDVKTGNIISSDRKSWWEIW